MECEDDDEDDEERATATTRAEVGSDTLCMVVGLSRGGKRRGVTLAPHGAWPRAPEPSGAAELQNQPASQRPSFQL